MPRFLKVFLAGLIVSFLGSLPLGTTNVAAMQLSIDRGLLPAFYFSLGSLTVELIYVRLSLFAQLFQAKPYPLKGHHYHFSFINSKLSLCLC